MEDEERTELEIERMELVQEIETTRQHVRNYDLQIRQYLDGQAFRQTRLEKMLHMLGRLDEKLGGESLS